MLLFALALLPRLQHFSGEIDSLHAWRQCDTHNYITNFTQNGIALLSPAVCWMGHHQTLLLEFPLPEAIVAVLYQLFGEHLLIARLFFLLCFLLSAYFFYLIVKLWFSDAIALLALAFYLFAPLGIFYSRAIHIDFFVLALAHAGMYLVLRALKTQKTGHWLGAACCFFLGSLVKVPYIFYLAIPIIYAAFHAKAWKTLLKNVWWFAPSLLGVFAWKAYAIQVNGQIPNWDFIHNFNRFTDMAYWYFGTWHQRSIGHNWLLVFGRLWPEILVGYIGIALWLVGMFFSRKPKGCQLAIWWILATALYAVVFFNLNVKHDYYLIPFMAPLALLLAIGVERVAGLWQTRLWSTAVILAVFTWYAVSAWQYTEKAKYHDQDAFVDIGHLIKNQTKPEEAIVSVYGGLSPQCPLVLHRARRNGWSIPVQDISPELVESLRTKAQANSLLLVLDGGMLEKMQSYYQKFPNQRSVALEKHGLWCYFADLPPVIQPE